MTGARAGVLARAPTASGREGGYVQRFTCQVVTLNRRLGRSPVRFTQSTIRALGAALCGPGSCSWGALGARPRRIAAKRCAMLKGGFACSEVLWAEVPGQPVVPLRLHTKGVTGSIPVAPTTTPQLRALFCLLDRPCHAAAGLSDEWCICRGHRQCWLGRARPSKVMAKAPSPSPPRRLCDGSF